MIGCVVPRAMVYWREDAALGGGRGRGMMRRLEGIGRRQVLGFAGAIALTGLSFPATGARRIMQPRALAFQNLHTGEKLSTVYWADGRYLSDAMRHINWLLRDFRTDETHPIDPALLDLLTDLHA